MNLIDEVEISYFRSFYKFKMRDLGNLNIIFGKNDSGKSNIIRALNLFFSGKPEHTHPFEFPIDFCEQRLSEAESSEDVRKFLYVKVTFNTPPSYQRSLGKKFYVKRQWTVSRGNEYHEEFSNSIPSNRRHIATRFLNKIKFIYIPAIKDIRIFEMLLAGIHETIASSNQFQGAVEDFSNQLQNITSDMFHGLPREVSSATKIGAPTQLSQLFQTLDFETTADGEVAPKSLTRQRGDGVKVRHIPELLKFISENDVYDYHIWGFEEPENSLDFGAAQSESARLLDLARDNGIQIFITTHSPSFYLLKDDSDLELISKYYVTKDDRGLSNLIQGNELNSIDPQLAIGDGFYLPAVAEALESLAKIESQKAEAEVYIVELRRELQRITQPVVLTEGRTDAKILITAWNKLRAVPLPFSIRTCETGGEMAGSGNGGTSNLAIRLKGVAADHPHAVIGLFDYDAEGIKAYKLDRNFREQEIGAFPIKIGIHGRSYAACLPAPDFRQECKEYQNLPIEFMFTDEMLRVEVNGHKLILKTKMASTKIGEKKVEMELEDVTHYKDVVGNKTEFAEIIVPTFDACEFSAFESVFTMIEAIISHSNTNSR